MSGYRTMKRKINCPEFKTKKSGIQGDSFKMSGNVLLNVMLASRSSCFFHNLHISNITPNRGHLKQHNYHGQFSVKAHQTRKKF